MPRSPIPPVPEEAPIYHESFDADYFADGSDTDIAIPGFGRLDQSWSGYALSRAGETVIPYVIPALNSTYINASHGLRKTNPGVLRKFKQAKSKLELLDTKES